MSMLVVDVPERAFLEDANDVGEFEENDGVELLADGSANGTEELAGASYVLERVAAKDDVGGEMGVFFVVMILDELDALLNSSGVRWG